MSDFSSQIAASSEGIFAPIYYVFSELFAVAAPFLQIAEGASDLIGLIA